MYNGLLHAHSGLRWITLLLILVALVVGATQMKSTAANRKNKLALFALIFTHIQVLIGIVLYFVSPKVNFGSDMMSSPLLRFFTMEHALIMILAAVLITIGHSKAKKKATWGIANKTIAIYYGIALLLILSRIPWPFMNYGGSWF